MTANAISLPSGPGSIEGLGESFEPELNTGTAKYGLDIIVSPGTAGHAPSVALAYDSGRGNGPVGFGWDIGSPHVQRQTDKGVPRYVDVANGLDDDGDGVLDEADERDQFLTESGEELVPVAPMEDGYFFCENESKFMRYRRVAGYCSGLDARTCLADSECPAGESCSGFHWQATLRDGTLQEFGITPEARIAEAESGQVFKWLLERSTDTNGNTIIYHYRTFTGTENQHQRYLSGIEYGPGAPRATGTSWESFHFLAFEWEPRADWSEDGRAGFLVRTGMRLRAIAVGTQGIELPRHVMGDFNQDGTPDHLNRRYDLAYGADPHWSLLSSVTLIGADGVTPLPPMRLEYTSARPLDAVAADAGAVAVRNLPSQVMDNPFVDLVDLNGDALPDLVRTGGAGAHTGYLNMGETAGTMEWASGVDVGGDPRAAQIDLKSVGTIANLSDMNGDGLADLTYRNVIGDVYYFPNVGDVTWGTRRPMLIDGSTAAPPSPFGSTDVRVADLDFDKRMDTVQSVSVGEGAAYRIWFNRGGGQYARSTTVAPECDDADRCPGFMFSAPGVHIVDVNGDRLADLARLRPTAVEVMPGVGHGRFMPIVAIAVPDYVFDGDQLARARLEDITGDGLVDLVLERASPGILWYWINLGNATFDRRRIVTGMPAQFGISPEIRWADMNGNGTTDLVYADQEASPRLQIYDLGRAMGWEPSPKQLRLIDNGLGRQIAIEYRSAAALALAARADGNPWRTTSPIALQVVSRVSVTSGLDLDETPGLDTYVTDYIYRDPYYDGHEKEFRGFAFVKTVERGDQDAPTAVTRTRFHTGAPDGIDNDDNHAVDERRADGSAEEEPLKGKILAQEFATAAAGADSSVGDGSDAPDEETFERIRFGWRLRILHAASGDRDAASLDDRQVSFAFEADQRRLLIERDAGEAQELLVAATYDDFGNLIEKREEGLTSAEGDERITRTSFAVNEGRWVVSSPAQVVVSDATGQTVAESRSYYDGTAFEGLALRQVERGNLMRQDVWTDGVTFVHAVRNRYDGYGNVIEMLDPLGLPASPGHRREIGWDSHFHAFPARETIHTGVAASPLHVTAAYDLGFGVVVSNSDFNDHITRYEHDVFSRLTSITRPGDSAALPTVLYEYHLADPARNVLWVYDRLGRLSEVRDGGTASWVTTRTREESGLAGTLDAMTYSDGLGRSLARVEEDEQGFVVLDAVRFDARRRVRKRYQPYRVVHSGYGAPPASVPHTLTQYDPIGRPIVQQHAADVAGQVASRMTEYSPLRRRYIDELGQERVIVEDGLGRLREVQEVNGQERYVTRYAHNALGSLTSTRDARGNETMIRYDGLQRRISESDPDRGERAIRYDAASNKILLTDARGWRAAYSYDGVNRLTSETYVENAETEVPATASVRYMYDAATGGVDGGDGTQLTATNTRGMLVSVTDATGEEHRSYDERGRVVWEVKRIHDPESGVSTSYRTERVYDAMSRQVAVVYPDNDALVYAYNRRGLLAKISGRTFGDIIANKEYEASGLVHAIALGNGAREEVEYDPRLRMTKGSVRSAGEEAILDRLYTYDGASNITRIDDEVLDGANPLNTTQVFTYDALYRLTRVELPAASEYVEYAYDATGNLTMQRSNRDVQNIGAIAYGGIRGSAGRGGRRSGDEPGPHAWTSAGETGEWSARYDANGNVTALGDLELMWDYPNRLVRARTAGMHASYGYDYTDRRVFKNLRGQDGAVRRTEYVSRQFEVREDGEPVKYVFDGNRRVARITGMLDDTRPRIQRLRLGAGWNLVSLAVPVDSGPWLLSDAGALERVLRYDEASGAFHEVQRDGALSAGSVLWVRASRPALWTAVGPYKEPNMVPVARSGGFIPILWFGRYDVREFVAPGIRRLWRYHQETGKWSAFDPHLPWLFSAPFGLTGGGAIYAGASGGATVAPDTTSKILYYHTDHIGSSLAMSDQLGRVVERRAYYPFGDVRAESSFYRRPSEPYAFAEKETDGESGLQYFEARYLARGFGRFISVDPKAGTRTGMALENPQVLNPYAYALNNPVRLIDPTGEESTEHHDPLEAAKHWAEAAIESGRITEELTHKAAHAAEHSAEALKNVYLESQNLDEVTQAHKAMRGAKQAGRIAKLTSKILKFAGPALAGVTEFVTGKTKTTGGRIANSVGAAAVDLAYSAAFAPAAITEGAIGLVAPKVVEKYGIIGNVMSVIRLGTAAVEGGDEYKRRLNEAYFGEKTTTFEALFLTYVDQDTSWRAEVMPWTPKNPCARGCPYNPGR